MILSTKLYKGEDKEVVAVFQDKIFTEGKEALSARKNGEIGVKKMGDRMEAKVAGGLHGNRRAIGYPVQGHVNALEKSYDQAYYFKEIIAK